MRSRLERYRAMTPEEKLAEIDALCADGIALARAAGRFEQVMEWRDPLPESSKALLSRLRRAAAERGRDTP